MKKNYHGLTVGYRVTDWFDNQWLVSAEVTGDHPRLDFIRNDPLEATRQIRVIAKPQKKDIYKDTMENYFCIWLGVTVAIAISK